MATERTERGLTFRVPPFRPAAATVSCSIWNDSKVQSLVGVGRCRSQVEESSQVRESSARRVPQASRGRERVPLSLSSFTLARRAGDGRRCAGADETGRRGSARVRERGVCACCSRAYRSAPRASKAREGDDSVTFFSGEPVCHLDFPVRASARAHATPRHATPRTCRRSLCVRSRARSTWMY